MNILQLLAFGWLGINYIPGYITVLMYRGIDCVFGVPEYNVHFASKRYMVENTLIISFWFVALPVLPFYTTKLIYNSVAALI